MATMRQDDMLREASFVFIGTVRALGASAMAEVPAAANTAIVEIDEVLVSAPAFKSRRGVVTLALRAEPALQVGQRRAFYCTAWKLGSGLALHCLGHRAAPHAKKLLVGRLAAASVNVQGADLRTRLQEAELVANGEVVRVQPGPPRRGPVSEHDPDWQEAVIRIESVAKGDAPGAEVSLFFPASQDVVWAGAPRPQPGQRGVWALRSAQGADAAAKAERGLQLLPPAAFTALHPLDFQPEAAMPAIRALTRPKAPRRVPLKARS